MFFDHANCVTDAVGRQVGNGHAGALLGERDGGRLADAAGRTGNEGDSVGGWILCHIDSLRVMPIQLTASAIDMTVASYTCTTRATPTACEDSRGLRHAFGQQRGDLLAVGRTSLVHRLVDVA